jgi:hypothetical protein
MLLLCVCIYLTEISTKRREKFCFENVREVLDVSVVLYVPSLPES